jgi:hypothetical protein
MMMTRALALGALLMGCSSSGDGAYDYASSKGAALYQDQCQVCHGETGEGGLGPALVDSPRSEGDLANIIAMRMPANNPGQCTGECASELASFIKHGLTTKALACTTVEPGPRRLRLLTRREYRATVRDLFGMDPMTCSRASDCGFRDSCTQGACEATACDAQTFVFDPHGQQHTTVQVAGDFTQWSPSLGLSYSASTGLWSGTFTIGEGHHQYKLVLDGTTWVTDPRAPSSAPDGYGGQNSALDLACSGAQAGGDPTADFPVETRKAGFPFDTDADAALVTSAHIDAYLAAAQKLAAAVSCDDCVTAYGEKLFRRPLTDDEKHAYAAMDGKTALAAMLMSPHFLYRSELGEPDRGHYKLTPYEVATALSYTFLGTTPGDELLAAAASGELTDAASIEKWARMLIADPRAHAQVGEFAAQWTGANDVLTADKRMDLYPDFDDATRASLLAETRDFAADVVFSRDGSDASQLTAGYTILDDVAAKFYGAQPGHVQLPNRTGVLGDAAVLASVAHSDQTSPVKRGLLVRRNFLCEDLPPPPPNGGSLPSVDPNATTRDRFAMHSSSAACSSCHMYIDKVGFGFEHFDPVGRWRDMENGKPVDGTGDMNDVERLGTDTSHPFSSLPELAAAIATSKAGPACFVRQYLRFSRGLRETLAERCDRLWVASKWNGDVRELMVQSVLAPDFLERR